MMDRQKAALNLLSFGMTDDDEGKEENKKVADRNNINYMPSESYYG